MGNSDSHEKDKPAAASAKPKSIATDVSQGSITPGHEGPASGLTRANESLIKRNFEDGDGQVKDENVLKLFDEWICLLLLQFARRTSGLGDGETVPIDAFASACGRLVLGGNAEMVELFCTIRNEYSKEDIKKMLIICCRAAGILCRKCDVNVAEAMCRSMIPVTRQTVTAEDLKAWIEQNCPRLFSSLRAQLRTGLLEKKSYVGQIEVPPSSILSPFMMWLLSVSLPKCYLTVSEQESQAYHAVWDPLYSSDEHGLSINRFELKVMGYRSPSTMLLELGSGELVAVAVDEEWRQSSTKWGGPNTTIVTFGPTFRKVSGANSLYFQIKLRNLQQGFSAADSFSNDVLVKLDSHLSEASAIEFWGCGDAKAKAGQLAQQLWEKRQTEKAKKVPLPGKWEENPDMILLEMAGVHKSYVEGPPEPVD